MRISPEAYAAIVRGERRGLGASLARGGLGIASWPYRLGAWARNRLFDRGWKTVHRTGVPVVSIGNLSLGGTGKTPCVEYVARFYRGLGIRPVILSRGYGAERGRNDEAMVLEENLPDVPHLQGADRVALAETAVEELEAELLILDDGFQHRRLHRDLDIVLIDATRPPHRDYLFPRGTLREPVGELRRAGFILLTRCDQVEAANVAEIRERLVQRFPAIPIGISKHRVTTGGDDLRGRTVAAFCGIGNPTAFRRTLHDLGAAIVAFRTFPDHHAYSRVDVDDLRDWASDLPPGAVLVTTQKDWVKLRLAELAGRPLVVVRIGLGFCEGQDAFDGALQRVMPAEAGP